MQFVSQQAIEYITRVADRFEYLGGQYAQDRGTFVMDMILAENADTDAPIDWIELLNSSATDFLHDCYGIQQYAEPDTGTLGQFVPRCAMDPGPYYDFTDSRVAQAMGEQVGPDNEPS